MSSRVLIVGASGFIGQRIAAGLYERAAHVRLFTRRRPAPLAAEGERTSYAVGDIRNEDSVRAACQGIDTVFHLAGHAHAWADTGDDLHREITVVGTRNLLRAAVAAGVKRFIFVSSVKAGGEGNVPAATEVSPAPPTTAYGRAKREAEDEVTTTGGRMGMHVCNLRLAMVYGVGMKGNLPRMIAAIDRGRFPPLPDTYNKRSMVWVEDVVQAALLAAEQPQANGKTYVVSDGHAYSTREIYEAICLALGRPLPRWTVPMSLLKAGAYVGDAVRAITRRRFAFDSEALEKLTGSAFYPSDAIVRELGFRPRKILTDVLPAIVEDYRSHGLADR